MHLHACDDYSIAGKFFEADGLSNDRYDDSGGCGRERSLRGWLAFRAKSTVSYSLLLIIPTKSV
jgi:hypothetical protein